MLKGLHMFLKVSGIGGFSDYLTCWNGALQTKLVKLNAFFKKSDMTPARYLL